MISTSVHKLGHSTKAWLLAIGVSAGLAPSFAQAQSGNVFFGGVTSTNGAAATATFTGPALTFSSQVRTGFGNTAAVAGAGALWWNSPTYSGAPAVFGNSSTLGEVLEITLASAAGTTLNVTSGNFGGYVNTARYVTVQLFNADYSQTTGPLTILTGAISPISTTFGANGWGNIIRVQFTETTSAGAPAGRGPFDVGTNTWRYTVGPVTDPSVVPEPSTYVLLGTGILMLGVVARRRSTL